MRHRAASAAFAAALILLPATSAHAEPCWKPPVPGPIVDHFRAPACPYCPGHRGVEFAADANDPVRAVGAGVVTFAGDVAGTGYVVVEHADAMKLTYGRLSEIRVGRGDRVVAGAILGEATGRLYFGLRIRDDYVDPEPFLGRLAGRPRLVPLDGTPRRPPPPPTLIC